MTQYERNSKKDWLDVTHSVQEILLASSKSVLPQPGVRGASVYQPAFDALSANPSHMCGMSPNPPMRTRPFSKVFFGAVAVDVAVDVGVGVGVAGGTDKAMDLSRARSCRLLHININIDRKRKGQRDKERPINTMIVAAFQPRARCCTVVWRGRG